MEQLLVMFIIIYVIGAIVTMGLTTKIVFDDPKQPWIMATFVIFSGLLWWVYILLLLRKNIRRKNG